MRKYFASLAVFVSMLGLLAPASAAVVQGSTYSFYLEGSESVNNSLFVATFDGIAESGPRNGQAVTINESETALGDNRSLISITLSSLSDLFPASDETAILAIGSEDALDFDATMSISLDDARVTLRDLAGAILFESDNLDFLAQQPSPWDGRFPAPSGAFGIDEIGGMGVASITFDFIVTQVSIDAPVPEPGSILLCGLGLLALGAARRKMQSRA